MTTIFYKRYGFGHLKNSTSKITLTTNTKICYRQSIPFFSRETIRNFILHTIQIKTAVKHPKMSLKNGQRNHQQEILSLSKFLAFESSSLYIIVWK